MPATKSGEDRQPPWANYPDLVAGTNGANGEEVDEKLLTEEAAKPQTYKWPGGKLKDGSIANY